MRAEQIEQGSRFDLGPFEGWDYAGGSSAAIAVCGVVVTAVLTPAGQRRDTPSYAMVAGKRWLVGLDDADGRVVWQTALPRGAGCWSRPVRGELVCIVDNAEVAQTYCGHAELERDPTMPTCREGVAPGVDPRPGFIATFIRLADGAERSGYVDADSLTVARGSLVTARSQTGNGRVDITVTSRRDLSERPRWTTDVQMPQNVRAGYPKSDYGASVWRLTGTGDAFVMVSAGTADGRVLNADNGRQIVAVPLVGGSRSATALPGDKAAVTGVDGITVYDAVGRPVRRDTGIFLDVNVFPAGGNTQTYGVERPAQDIGSAESRELFFDAATNRPIVGLPVAVSGYPDAPPPSERYVVGRTALVTSESGYPTLGLTYHYYGAVDLDTGNVLWTKPGKLADGGVLADDGRSVVLVAENYAGLKESDSVRVGALDLRTGQITWRTTVPGHRFYGGVNVGDQRIVNFGAPGR
ncbi:hypothetical protein GCM10009624_00180 [Gordonia sinesedis]